MKAEGEGGGGWEKTECRKEQRKREEKEMDRAVGGKN